MLGYVVGADTEGHYMKPCNHSSHRFRNSVYSLLWSPYTHPAHYLIIIARLSCQRGAGRGGQMMTVVVVMLPELLCYVKADRSFPLDGGGRGGHRGREAVSETHAQKGPRWFK